MVDPEIIFAGALYFILCARFFYVYMEYQNKALAVEGLYCSEAKNSMLFKTLIVGRTLITSMCAPFFSFFVPSYLDVFWNGIDLDVKA